MRELGATAPACFRADDRAAERAQQIEPLQLLPREIIGKTPLEDLAIVRERRAAARVLVEAAKDGVANPW